MLIINANANVDVDVDGNANGGRSAGTSGMLPSLVPYG